ncbi:hypothetical protein R75461_05408 [Paraburkholderia nemoris]|nr:hypothetical protein R75461_05408 [Paraburkholderia nemoris]
MGWPGILVLGAVIGLAGWWLHPLRRSSRAAWWVALLVGVLGAWPATWWVFFMMAIRSNGQYVPPSRWSPLP